MTLSFLDGMLPPHFIEDRLTAMAPGFFDRERAACAAPAILGRLRAACLRVDRQLSDGRQFLLGDAPCLADFSGWVSFGHAFAIESAAPAIAGCQAVRGWHARMAPFDTAVPPSLAPEQGVEIAAAAEPRPATVDAEDAAGLAPGERLRISHSGYCEEPIEGELVGLDPWTLSLRREDARAGTIVVHVPREGIDIVRATSNG